MSKCNRCGAGEEHHSTIYETPQEIRGIGSECNNCGKRFCCAPSL